MNTDEEYLISQVLSSLKTDIAAAKSWMIFSKSAYPASFPVLFQSYKMECEEKNLNESVQCLSDLIKQFPNEIVLVNELRNIAKALCSENNDFSKHIFEKLPEDIKYEIMLAITRNSPTVEEHCEMMLLFLKRMSSSRLATHGKNLIDTLLSAEEHSGLNSPINLFRKMLVCDALPLILRVPQFDYMYKIIVQLLQKAVEFYVSCMFTLPTAQGAGVWKEVTSHLDGNHEDGWKPLLKLLETIATRNRWNYPEMFVSNFSDLSLHQMLSLLKKRNKTLSSLISEKHRREEMSGYDEAYFCLVVTFFFYLYNFGKNILSKMPTNSPVTSYNYILVEGVSHSSSECPKTMGSEFKRTERGFMVTSRTASPETAGMIVPAFTTAVECWELLHKHQHLMNEFKILCKNLQLETWPVFQEFYISMLIYERAHRDAIDHLTQIRDSSPDIMVKNKTALQIASCYHFLGEQEQCLKLLFDVVMNLTSSPYTAGKPLGKCSSRFLYFLGYNNKEILEYCVSTLLKLFKCKERVENSYKNRTIGYMLVLMQYDLQHEYDLLHKCIEMIKKNRAFGFQKFFDYIINVDILEEISYLATPTGGNVKLEILSTPTFQASMQRAVTRGVNKGARDDLKQAFMNQMSRCYDNLDNLFIEFIKEEHKYLLMSATG